MDISVMRPWVLMLLPLLLLLLYLSLHVLLLPKLKKRFVFVLRGLIFTVLLCAMAGISLRWEADHTVTLFAVDVSDSSIRDKSKAEAFVQSALTFMSSKDRAGVLAFAAEVQVEALPKEKPLFEGIRTTPRSDATDVEQVLKTAMELMPKEANHRIVLLSDGLENVGDALETAKRFKEQKIRLDVVPLSAFSGTEVVLRDIALPSTLRHQERFELRVKVYSSVHTEGMLRIFDTEKIVFTREVELNKGENLFSFSLTATQKGTVAFSAEILPNADTILSNNKKTGMSQVIGSARILLIENADKDGEALFQLMQSNFDVTRIQAAALPQSLEALFAYDAFVLANVAAEELGEGVMKNMEISVREQGKGFFVIGGEKSFALGGYQDTPLEKILPVAVTIQPKDEEPNLGLMLVMDKSGSMTEARYGLQKIEMAKEAAIRSAGLLKASDTLGVIAFDDTLQWVLRPQPAADQKVIETAIASIRAGGGTQILPPLRAGFEAIRAAEVRLRHIILLTDGQAESSGYEDILAQMQEHGVTLSTVAVGNGADTQLLSYLANRGKGRYYFTDAFSDIPKILAKETFLAANTYLNNRSFLPKVSAASFLIKDIPTFPEMKGYVATTLKPRATEVLQTDQQHPLLAHWQVGLGRSVAWTSDFKGMWSAGLFQWGDKEKFWKNILSYVVQDNSDAEIMLKPFVDKGQNLLKIGLNPKEKLHADALQVDFLGSSGRKETVTASLSNSDEYTAPFNLQDIGLIFTQLRFMKDGEVFRQVASAFVKNYSREYEGHDNSQQNFLERLAYETGGRLLLKPEEVFQSTVEKRITQLDLTDFFLLLLPFFLLFEIALRRLSGIEKYFYFMINYLKRSKTVMPVAAVQKISKDEKTAEKTQQATEKLKEARHIEHLIQKKKGPRAW